MIDPVDLISADGSIDALAALGARLVELGYQAQVQRGGERGQLVAFGMGRPAAADSIRSALGAPLLADLVRIGLVRFEQGAEEADATVAVAGELIPAGDTLAFAPEHDHEGARVYAGRDTMFLLEILWRTTLGGRRAVDLGAGTGLTSAVLARRYEIVIASELVPRAAAAALVTRALNLRSASGPRFPGSIVADVAGGLRPGSFDLVTANAPWVPRTGLDERGERLVYADGGDRGRVLPRRFAIEGADLLAPGGLLAMLTLDAVWADGCEPVADLRRELEARGLLTQVVPTRMAGHDPQFEQKLLDALPDLRAARHVALLARRPR